MANSLIPSVYRQGRILDIGCGAYPLFLLSCEFSEKYGLDKALPQFSGQKINLIKWDVEKDGLSLFDSGFFDVVTMLAVFEHIDPPKLTNLNREIHRVLKKGGLYIITTPAVWTDKLLRIMAKLKLVSSVEIEEHKDAYNHKKISSILQRANFERLRFGYFEMYMNNWVVSTK